MLKLKARPRSKVGIICIVTRITITRITQIIYMYNQQSINNYQILPESQTLQTQYSDYKDKQHTYLPISKHLTERISMPGMAHFGTLSSPLTWTARLFKTRRTTLDRLKHDTNTQTIDVSIAYWQLGCCTLLIYLSD